MATIKPKKSADYIVPLNMNGLRGRMLKMPPPKAKKPAGRTGGRELLLIYGHHASLERFFGLAEALNDYVGVTMPDLPGFGGMDPFYKIGEKPSLDNMADYLATFIKLRYKNNRFSMAGVSYGFLVITRMLQKYPEMAKKVDLFVSIVGFTKRDEFLFSKPRYYFYRGVAAVFAWRLPSIFFRNIILHPAVLRAFYSRTHNAKHKFKGLSATEKRKITEFEIYLWRANEIRTYMFTSTSLLTVDNCNKKIDLPVWHLSVKKDNYFDNHIVEQHMRIIFNDFHNIPIKLNSHAISVIADKKDAKAWVPKELRDILRQTS